MSYRSSHIPLTVPRNMPFTTMNVYNFNRIGNAPFPTARNLRAKLGAALGVAPTYNAIRTHPIFSTYLDRLSVYRANKRMICIPPNAPITARNVYNLHKYMSREGSRANAARTRIATALGLPQNASWLRIMANPQYQPYLEKWQKIFQAGSFKSRNFFGANRHQTLCVPLLGKPYRPASTEAAQATGWFQRGGRGVFRIWSGIPRLKSRRGLLALGLASPPHNARGPQRPALPPSIAKKIANMVHRLERANLEQWARYPYSTRPPPRSLRALVGRRAVVPPHPPRNNSSNNNNNAVRPRRRPRAN